jgi:hypothetical protein
MRLSTFAGILAMGMQDWGWTRTNLQCNAGRLALDVCSTLVVGPDEAGRKAEPG